MKKIIATFKKLLPKKREAGLTLPHISTPYNQAVKKQQEALVISLIIAIAVASFYSYFYTQSQIEAEQKIEVIIFNKDLEAPHKITAGDLSQLYVPQGTLPEGSFNLSEQDQLIDQTLTQSVKSKQLVLAHYLQTDLDPNSISAKFDDLFALSMDEDWFVAKFANLKANDRIDIVVSNPREDLAATTTLARSLKVISVSKSGNKRSLVINTSEDEAKAILFAKGLKLPMQILIHAAVEKTTQPIIEEVLESNEINA